MINLYKICQVSDVICFVLRVMILTNTFYRVELSLCVLSLVHDIHICDSAIYVLSENESMQVFCISCLYLYCLIELAIAVD